jgi:hypothetical protein
VRASGMILAAPERHRGVKQKRKAAIFESLAAAIKFTGEPAVSVLVDQGVRRWTLPSKAVVRTSLTMHRK